MAIPMGLTLLTPLTLLPEINDSGVYLPPSPPATKTRPFWGHTTSSRSTTSSHRSANPSSHRSDADSQFNISRESFDSYRRSFDISARSPVIRPSLDIPGRSDGGSYGRPRMSLDSRGTSNGMLPPRASLDSRTFVPPPTARSSNSFQRPSPLPAQTKEEEPAAAGGGFEDVDISEKPSVVAPKKRGLFARITESAGSSSGDVHGEERRPGSAEAGGKSWMPFSSGRRRGQSGQGAELGSMTPPAPALAPAPSPLGTGAGKGKGEAGGKKAGAGDTQAAGGIAEAEMETETEMQTPRKEKERESVEGEVMKSGFRPAHSRVLNAKEKEKDKEEEVEVSA